jgi:DNA-binding LacI/PurR family transcriptional regulator
MAAPSGSLDASFHFEDRFGGANDIVYTIACTSRLSEVHPVVRAAQGLGIGLGPQASDRLTGGTAGRSPSAAGRGGFGVGGRSGRPGVADMPAKDTERANRPARRVTTILSDPPGIVARDAAGGPSPVRTGPAAPVHVPTMQDIARASGVSQSTVSRVLAGTPTIVPINQTTRERVLAVARQMRYRPNPLARGLRGARTMLLGVIVREITDPFFAGAVDAVSSEATKRGYNVVLGHAHGRADEAIAVRAVLETRHCDAILLLGDTSDQRRFMEDLRAANLRVVGMWQGNPSMPGLFTVTVDNVSGIRDLMAHLLGLGHRRVAFIGGTFWEGRELLDIVERRAAFLDRMAEAGLKVPDEYVCDARNDLNGGAEALEYLMQLPVRPTAVVASTDVLAIGALHAAGNLGLNIPADLSIVGFDDLPMAEYTNPALTTVRMPMAEMAAVGVGAAIDTESAAATPAVQVLAPTLVLRDSSGPPPAE